MLAKLPALIRAYFAATDAFDAALGADADLAAGREPVEASRLAQRRMARLRRVIEERLTLAEYLRKETA